MGWTLTLDDKVWTDQDLTVDQAISVADIIGKGWLSVHPQQGPREASTLLAVLLADSPDDPGFGAAMARVKAMSAAELASCVEVT